MIIASTPSAFSKVYLSARVLKQLIFMLYGRRYVMMSQSWPRLGDNLGHSALMIINDAKWRPFCGTAYCGASGFRNGGGSDIDTTRRALVVLTPADGMRSGKPIGVTS